MRAPALKSLLRRFRRSEQGLAAIEMALTAPFLVLLLLGGYDVSRFVSIRAGVDKVGFSVADVTSQYDQLNPTTMAQIFKITGSSLPNYVSGTNGVTILTSVAFDSSNAAKVSWQCYSTSGGTWKSKVGVPGGAATINSGLLSDQKDNLIIAEVYYKFDPIFKQFFKNGFDVYTQSLYRPRLNSLTNKPC